MAKLTSVIIIRHGERMDEADREAWRKIRTQETQYDAPLTLKGWEQATAASRKVLETLRPPPAAEGVAEGGLAAEGPVVAAVYSSPTARTMATAAAVAKELGVNSVSPAYGLNCCAAAKQLGVASTAFNRQIPEDIMRGVAVACWPPVGDVGRIDRRNRQPRGFVESVMELAAMHAPGETIVLVSHREGLWEILQHTSGRMYSGYCCTRYFQYNHGKRDIDAWSPEADAGEAAAQDLNPLTPRPPPRPPGSLKPPSDPSERRAEKTAATAAVRARESNKEPADLREVLERGYGSVVMDRKGRGGAGRTLLWQTPGVRGVWVPRSGVSDGTVVELLSSPLTSEGDEGNFVIVRLKSGIEGWTKVKNIALVA